MEQNITLENELTKTHRTSARKELPYVNPNFGKMSDYPHYHREIEILRCDVGKLFITVNDEKFTLTQNQIIFLMPYEIHNIITDVNSYGVLVKMIPNISQETFSFLNIVFSSRIIDGSFECFEQINEELNIASREATEKQIGYELALSSATNNILMHYLRNVDFSFLSQSSIDNEKSRIHLLKKIDQFMEKNYASNFTLNDIANYCNASTSYLSHNYKPITGMSFSEYVARYRLNKATELIATTNMSVLDIAYTAGFGSIQTFSRTLKKIFNITPKQYIQLIRKK